MQTKIDHQWNAYKRKIKDDSTWRINSMWRVVTADDLPQACPRLKRLFVVFPHVLSLVGMDFSPHVLSLFGTDFFGCSRRLGL